MIIDMAVQEKERVAYWSQRFVHYGNHARSLYEKTVQLIIGATTILLTASVALAAYGRFEILLVVPVVVLLIWTAAARMLDEQGYLFLYADHAEQVLADLGLPDASPLSVWWSYAGRKLGRGYSNIMLFGISALVSAVLIGGSLVLAALNLPELAAVILVESLVVSVISAALVVGMVHAEVRRRAARTMLPLQ
jgi:hypothetical protein